MFGSYVPAGCMAKSCMRAHEATPVQHSRVCVPWSSWNNSHWPVPVVLDLARRDVCLVSRVHPGRSWGRTQPALDPGAQTA